MTIEAVRRCHTPTATEWDPDRTPASANDNWQDRAICASMDPEIWFSDAPDMIATAIRLCHRCPVVLSCLTEAKTVGVAAGVWGGVDFHPRRHSR